MATPGPPGTSPEGAVPSSSAATNGGGPTSYIGRTTIPSRKVACSYPGGGVLIEWETRDQMMMPITGLIMKMAIQPTSFPHELESL